jgi:selenocysteine-specific elongation factor
VLPAAPRPLRSRQRVRVHHGTAEVLARVAVLEESGEIAPGAAGLAQLRLEAPIIALPSDRFIVRTYSPQQTLAGGEILDAHANRHRGRDRAAARASLRALAAGDEAERLRVFAAASAERGLRRPDLAARTGWTDGRLDAGLAEALRRGLLVGAHGVYVGRELFERLLGATLAEVEAFHAREPLARGLPREALRERIFARAEPELFRAVVEEGERRGALVSDRDVVRAGGHSLELSPADAALRDRLEALYRDAGLEPPALEEALVRAAAAGERREHVRKIFQLLLDAGSFVRVREDLFFHRAAVDGLVRALGEYASRREPDRLIDVAAFKELTGVSRKYAIPLLEYFDRERVTRRAGDRRMIL